MQLFILLNGVNMSLIIYISQINQIMKKLKYTLNKISLCIKNIRFIIN